MAQINSLTEEERDVADYILHELYRHPMEYQGSCCPKAWLFSWEFLHDDNEAAKIKALEETVLQKLIEWGYVEMRDDTHCALGDSVVIDYGFVLRFTA